MSIGDGQCASACSRLRLMKRLSNPGQRANT
jgi:hypothetical protein